MLRYHGITMHMGSLLTLSQKDIMELYVPEHDAPLRAGGITHYPEMPTPMVANCLLVIACWHVSASLISSTKSRCLFDHQGCI